MLTLYLLALWAEILINLFATLEPRFYEVLRNILPPLLISLHAKLVRLILSKCGGNNTKCQLIYNQKSE